MLQVRGARQALSRAIRLKCPRCGLGLLFRGVFTMRARCPVCHLRFEREPGYFVGAIYINYAATVLTVMAGYFVLDALVELSLRHQLVLWGTFSLVFPLWFFRYSKSLWLSLDNFLDPEGRQDEE
ncbi:MAG: DUF983 domain-containing protein [Candidatus Methylomirabilia bacterium]